MLETNTSPSWLICSPRMTLCCRAPHAVSPCLLSGASQDRITALSQAAAWRLLGQKPGRDQSHSRDLVPSQPLAGGHRLLGNPAWSPLLSVGASCQQDPITGAGDKLFPVSIFHLKCKLDLTE